MSVLVRSLINPDCRLAFLDEPTTGLDSEVADALVGVLSCLANTRNMAFTAVLHQLSSRSWDLLDRVLVVSRGRVCYLGAPADARAWCAGAGLLLPLNESTPNALVDCVTEERAANSLARAYSKHQQQQLLQDMQRDGDEQHDKAPNKMQVAASRSQRNGVLSQVRATLGLQFKDLWAYRWKHLGVLCVMATKSLFIGTMFFRDGEQQDAVETINFSYQLTFLSIDSMCLTMGMYYFTQRRRCRVEMLLGWYSVGAHVLSWLLLQAVVALFAAVAQLTLAYGFSGFSAGTLPVALLMCWLCNYAVMGVAMWVASFAADSAAIMLVCSVLVMAWNITSGVFISKSQSICFASHVFLMCF